MLNRHGAWSPYRRPGRAGIVGTAGWKGAVDGCEGERGGAEGVGGRRRRRALHEGRHWPRVGFLYGRGFPLVRERVDGVLAAKGQASRGRTSESGSSTKLCHGNASVEPVQVGLRRRRYISKRDSSQAPFSDAAPWPPSSTRTRDAMQGPAVRWPASVAGADLCRRRRGKKRCRSNYRWDRFHSQSNGAARLLARRSSRFGARGVGAAAGSIYERMAE